MLRPVRRTLAAAFLILLSAAAPARATSPWIVFFESGSARLTAQAEEILEGVPEALRTLDVRRIEIVGTADRQGPAAANLALSRRRAQAVRDWLVRRGFPAGRIEIEAWGEARPLVATADGIAEPQNRSAMVVIKALCRPALPTVQVAAAACSAAPVP